MRDNPQGALDQEEKTTIDKKSMAIGIAVGIAIVGCIAAIDGPEKEAEGRYQLVEMAQYPFGYTLFILDTETGTLNAHDGGKDGHIEPTVVYPFVGQ